MTIGLSLISHTIAEFKIMLMQVTQQVSIWISMIKQADLFTTLLKKKKKTVESLLKEQFPDINKFRNVHQLDYATSGVFVLALNKKAAAAASKLFRDRTVKKTYLALVNGHVKEDE